jgi:plastocyanin
MQPKKIGIGIVAIIVIGIIATVVGSSSGGASSNVVVNNALGSSTPGCEPDCFIPTTATIRAGGTITWVNGDTAAHTATAGTAADGPSGVWDSSLIMAGGSYSYTADTAGTYDYFCMVHPWMVGAVIVR